MQTPLRAIAIGWLPLGILHIGAMATNSSFITSVAVKSLRGALYCANRK